MKRITTIFLTLAILTFLTAATHFASANADKREISASVLPTVCENIIFASARSSGKYDLVVMKPDGSGKVGLLPADLSGVHPKVSRNGRKILFASRTSASDNLYVMNSDGSGIVQLTNAAADNGESAAFSPDGTKIFFTRLINSNGIFDYDIFSINVDGTGLTQLTPSDGNFDFFLSLSPDGTKILFSRSIDKGTLNEPYDLYSMNADGTNQFRLTNSTEFQNINYAEFSPDGSRILFGSSGSLDHRIETVNADGSGRTRLSPVGFFSIHARFNPDATKIVYASDGGSGNSSKEIYTMNADGTGAANLTTSAEDESEPRYNLDGTKILFSRGGKLFIMNSDGTNKTEIAVIPGANGLNNYTAAFIDPDGDGIGSGCDNCPLAANGFRVAFSSTRDGNAEIYTMNRDGSGVTRLTNLSRSDTEPSFSFDGNRIVFTSDRLSSRREIYVMNANGSGITRLTNVAGGHETASFSPDGTKITFISSRDNNGTDNINNLYIMNSDGTNPIRLTTNQGFSGVAYNPTFNHDGSRIAFSTQRGGVGAGAYWDIFTINPDGTGETRLTNAAGEDNDPSYSRDGSRIVFVSKRDGNSEIYVMNSDGTNQIRLTNHQANDLQPVFTPDGTQIAFFSNRDADTELYIMNADGSNVTRLTQTVGSNSYPSFAPQADTDGDGVGDACDNCALSNPTQADGDADTIADSCDNCPTTPNTDQANADGDAEGDACDLDDDNDGLPDTADNCPLIANPTQADNDVDGLGDSCDPDDDNDMVLDAADNCPLVANTNQADADGDAIGDACDADDDNDKLPDGMDNCPLNFNPDQLDTDTDGLGDECDADDDNDGVLDETDNCQFVANPNQADADGDGTGDSCDDDFDVDTPTGSNVTVAAPNATVRFSGVTEEGTTSFTPISPDGLPTGGYTLCSTCPAFDITTTALYTPPVTVCLQVPASMTQEDFFRLRLMHGENGAYIDRTTERITNGSGTRFVCGEVQSLSPFALGFAPPTSAIVTIGGRVADSEGRAIGNAQITLTAPDGSQRSAGSNTFGYYRFTDVPTGQTYVLTIRSKRFVFNPNARIVNVIEELSDLDWTAANTER